MPRTSKTGRTTTTKRTSTKGTRRKVEASSDYSKTGKACNSKKSSSTSRCRNCGTTKNCK